jgi:hypothetical protein
MPPVEVLMLVEPVVEVALAVALPPVLAAPVVVPVPPPLVVPEVIDPVVAPADVVAVEVFPPLQPRTTGGKTSKVAASRTSPAWVVRLTWSRLSQESGADSGCAGGGGSGRPALLDRRRPLHGPEVLLAARLDHPPTAVVRRRAIIG